MKLFQPIQGSQGSIESKETQENLTDRGQLQINVTSSVNAFPVKERGFPSLIQEFRKVY